MNIHKLIEQLTEILYPLNEMSMAFHYEDKNTQVCAWVENSTPRDNCYFKYYNNSRNKLADKVARIRIDKAEYVGGNHRERNLKKWILSKNEKQQLINILNSPSNDYPNITKWQDILITYNRDNFFIKAEDTINGNINNYSKNPILPDHVKPFSIDHPMPNYLNL